MRFWQNWTVRSSSARREGKEVSSCQKQHYVKNVSFWIRSLEEMAMMVHSYERKTARKLVSLWLWSVEGLRDKWREARWSGLWMGGSCYLEEGEEIGVWPTTSALFIQVTSTELGHCLEMYRALIAMAKGKVGFFQLNLFFWWNPF